MKLYTENDLIDLVQSLKDYTHESRSILGHDERDAKEFVHIFLKDRSPIELPSDEEIEQIASDYRSTSEFCDIQNFEDGAVFSIKWMCDKIGGNKWKSL